jgi:hypothetical protein
VFEPLVLKPAAGDDMDTEQIIQLIVRQIIPVVDAEVLINEPGAELVHERRDVLPEAVEPEQEFLTAGGVDGAEVDRKSRRHSHILIDYGSILSNHKK